MEGDEESGDTGGAPAAKDGDGAFIWMMTYLFRILDH